VDKYSEESTVDFTQEMLTEHERVLTFEIQNYFMNPAASNRKSGLDRGKNVRWRAFEYHSHSAHELVYVEQNPISCEK
jgi:hypothetical protein